MNATEQMTLLVKARNWDGVLTTLGRLSNSQFRLMEKAVREQVLTQLDNDLFWEALSHLIIYKRQAFISGIVAAEHLVGNDTLDFHNHHVETLARHLMQTKPESLQKLCNMMMPLLRSEQQVRDMFHTLHVENPEARLASLLKTDSPLSYYVIFKTLKECDEKTVAYRCCQALMKRHDDMAFNAVCIIKAYFGLDDLPGRFSLRVEQYELSHIDRNFDTFKRALYGKRPQL